MRHLKVDKMKTIKKSLRIPVLIWTVLTTTFFWTSLMRILLKPEISNWSIFNLGGKGLLGDNWLPPLVVLFALFVFYLEGRGKFRTIYHVLIISWNLLITGVIVYGSLQSDAQIAFETWGVSLSFIWLPVPFILFLILTIALVTQEKSGMQIIPSYDWGKINWNPFIIALLLFPVALIFFRLGSGFDWMIKIAVGSTIIQWILLTEAIGRPYALKSKQTNKSTIG